MAKIPRPLPLEKHADAVEFYVFDFTDYLAAGETLTGTPTVTVAQGAGSAWTDYSTDFIGGSNSPTIINTSTAVRQKLIAAAAGTQTEGEYVMLCSVDTTQGRTLTMAGDLVVSEKGRV